MEHFERLRACAQQMKKDIGSFINSGNVFHRTLDDVGRGATLTITKHGTIRASIHRPTPTGVETFWGWFYATDTASVKRLIRQIAV